MTSNNLVIIYKEVGKKPEFRLVENKLTVLQDLVGGELDFIAYEDIIIVAKKNNDNLRPNIYINTSSLKFASSIRGNIFIVCMENENFISLNKYQAITYRELLIRASFNYTNFDENNRYIPKRKRNKDKKNKDLLVLEKSLGDNDIAPIKNNPMQVSSSEEVLSMILEIQNIILKFIKNNKEGNE